MCAYRHAQDVRELYERKLERANNLYMELCACMLQMEKRERELAKSVVSVVSRSFCSPFARFIYAIVRSLILLIPSFFSLFVHSLIHLIVHSLIHFFAPALGDSIVHSVVDLLFVCHFTPFILPFVHCFIKQA